MVRKYKGGNTMLSIARKNLKVETGCSGHADKFLEVWPVEAAKIKEGAAIPVSALFGGSPDIPDSEAKEKEFLKKPQKFVKNSPRAGWKDPVGLKAYSKKAAYPNLYFYFDASDISNNVNKFPGGGIRGNIVLVRQEAPVDQTGAKTAKEDLSDFTIKQLQETLWYFKFKVDATEEGVKRDRNRVFPELSAGVPYFGSLGKGKYFG